MRDNPELTQKPEAPVAPAEQPSTDTVAPTPLTVTAEEEKAMQRVRDIKGFYGHLRSYLTVTALLFGLNLLTDPSYIWAVWPALGWGIGVAHHALGVFEVFSFFSPAWEKKQVEKQLGRKL